MNIAQYIVKARRSLNMSQAQFATALGVSQGSVSKWEASKESPRAEVIERIKELTGSLGVQEPTVTLIDPSREDEFDSFVEVSLKGRFTDALPAEIHKNDGIKTLYLYLSAESQGEQLEAWAVRGFYDDLPRSFIGVFARFSPGEILKARTAASRRHTILVETTGDDGQMRLSLEEINGSDRHGWWLWPLDSRSRNRNLPMKLTAEGTSESGAVRPRGLLVYALYQPTNRRGFTF